MKKNEIVRLCITDITNEGNGVGRADDGMAVFVPFTAVGDVVDVKIVKVQKSFAYGITEKLVERSQSRCDADCEVFYKCGGCSLRHISYESELEIKQGYVEASMTRIGKLDVEFEKILGCEKTEGYRNKAQYPVTMLNGEAVCGFYSKRSHRVVPVKHCKLQPKVFSEICNQVLKFHNDNKIPVYDEITGKGLLRHIYIRRGESSGEIMLCLVLTKLREDIYRGFAEYIAKCFPDIKSVVMNLNPKNTNVILGRKCVTLYGNDTITDIMCQNKIEISPLSFYQVNTKQAEKLYGIAKDYANLSKNDTVLDLYCGAGTIGLSMAREVKKVIGVEVVEDAIKNANRNAQLNGIKNAEFICGDSGEIAQKLVERGECPDVIIADPARKGCDKLSLDAMIKLSPSRIVMVSCNHTTAARDCAYLCENGYKTEKCRAVDLFPKTTHVECVILMSRK